MTVTVQTTSSMTESMLNANNVQTDVPNVLTVIPVQNVKKIELLMQMDLVLVMKDIMKNVEQQTV